MEDLVKKMAARKDSFGQNVGHQGPKKTFNILQPSRPEASVNYQVHPSSTCTNIELQTARNILAVDLPTEKKNNYNYPALKVSSFHVFGGSTQHTWPRAKPPSDESYQATHLQRGHPGSSSCHDRLRRGQPLCRRWDKRPATSRLSRSNGWCEGVYWNNNYSSNNGFSYAQHLEILEIVQFEIIWSLDMKQQTISVLGGAYFTSIDLAPLISCHLAQVSTDVHMASQARNKPESVSGFECSIEAHWLSCNSARAPLFSSLFCWRDYSIRGFVFASLLVGFEPAAHPEPRCQELLLCVNDRLQTISLGQSQIIADPHPVSPMAWQLLLSL